MPMGIGLGIGVTRGGGVGWWPAGSALDLDFANSLGFNSIDRTKLTPDSILTYTAPSPKLVYGSDGVLRYAPHNLIRYSEQFNDAAWVKVSGITVTSNQIPGPTGETTADLVVKNSTVFQAIRQSVTLASNSTVTQRIWAKGGNTNYIAFTDGASCALTVSLTNGAVTRNTGAFENVSVTLDGGFYRISFTQVLTAGAQNILYMWPTDVANSGGFTTVSATASMYLWGAQLNAGSSALTYIPTTSAAVYSLPIDYNPTTFDPLGVLIEEQRTNLLTYSEQFNDAAWTKSSSTVTANAATAPDGTTTADKLIPGAASGDGRASQSFTGAIGTTYTLTVYGKQAEFSNCRLYSDDGGSNVVSVSYNLSTGAVSTAVAVVGGNWTAALSTITSVGNGWYRMSLTWTATAVAPTRVVYWCRDTGNGTSGIYIWGAQLEAGAFPTSYIPTVASQVTRLADQVSILTSAFGYNAAAGTVAVDAQVPSNVDAPNGNYFFSISDGTTSNVIHIAEINGVRSQIVSGAAVQFDSTVGAEPTTGVFIKAAVGYAANDMRLARDGSLGTADTSGTVPSGLTILRVGLRGDANFITYTNGHIKRLTYFPTRRTDADLQVLST